MPHKPSLQIDVGVVGSGSYRSITFDVTGDSVDLRVFNTKIIAALMTNSVPSKMGVGITTVTANLDARQLKSGTALTEMINKVVQTIAERLGVSMRDVTVVYDNGSPRLTVQGLIEELNVAQQAKVQNPNFINPPQAPLRRL
jgi:hypothetical protein